MSFTEFWKDLIKELMIYELKDKEKYLSIFHKHLKICLSTFDVDVTLSIVSDISQWII